MRKRELYNKTHNTGLYQDLHEIQDAVFNSALNLINKTTKGEYKYSFCQIGMDESTSLLVFKLSTGEQYAFQDQITAQ